MKGAPENILVTVTIDAGLFTPPTCDPICQEGAVAKQLDKVNQFILVYN